MKVYYIATDEFVNTLEEIRKAAQEFKQLGKDMLEDLEKDMKAVAA